MNELKDPKKKKKTKKDERNLQLIHHGVNTQIYNQGPWEKDKNILQTVRAIVKYNYFV